MDLKCSICGKIGKYNNKTKRWNVIKHHVSYAPEEVVYLCRSCHIIAHTYSPLSLGKLIILIKKFPFNKDEYKEFYKKRNFDLFPDEIDTKELFKVLAPDKKGINLYRS